jgi:hypothetical protein
MGTENESQEDMLEDGYSKDISGRSEVATTLHDRPPSKKDSFLSDRSDIPPVSPEGI